jgi:hypothetical protein
LTRFISFSKRYYTKISNCLCLIALRKRPSELKLKQVVDLAEKATIKKDELDIPFISKAIKALETLKLFEI